jgi:hypothetical protein
LRNVVKYGKYRLAKFANFVYFFVLRAGIATIFGPANVVVISARNTKYTKLAKGYI